MIRNSELRVFKFVTSIEKMVLLGTICIKQLIKLIFVTLSGEIIKLEQPKLKLCLFWPKKSFSNSDL